MFGRLSKFSPNYSSILSMSSAYLYPALCIEMYPNDRIRISHEALLKSAPMLFTTYTPMKLTIDYFFNENRNVWNENRKKDWSTFITGAVNGKSITNESDLPIHPYIKVPEGGFKPGSLGDYLGFSSNPEMAGAEVSAMRFRHYQSIMRTFYADENLSIMPGLGLDEGLDTETSLELFKRCWNKDRFTTATLEPQKGISVGLPLAGTIPVHGDGTALGLTDGTNNMGLIGYGSNTQGSGIGMVAVPARYGTEVGSTGANMPLGVLNASAGVTTDPTKSGLVADISGTQPISIDELHFLTQVERLNQRDNMWGTRDFECIRTHFNINIPDTRLQRPTHLGREVVDVHFSEVLQTSQSSENSAQGNTTGHSLAVSKNRPIRFLCREHGFLMVIVNVQPIAQYQQGIPRDSLYKTRFDYMWPILSETGYQELFAAEVYGTKDNITARKIFGFEPRYNHLRFGEKTVHGDFRSTLSGYHAGRIFTSEPNLGEKFITCDATNRMFAVTSTGQDFMPWWLRIEFDTRLVRRLPQWPNPSCIGKLF